MLFHRAFSSHPSAGTFPLRLGGQTNSPSRERWRALWFAGTHGADFAAIEPLTKRAGIQPGNTDHWLVLVSVL
jgi:hypothetical protein